MLAVPFYLSKNMLAVIFILLLFMTTQSSKKNSANFCICCSFTFWPSQCLALSFIKVLCSELHWPLVVITFTPYLLPKKSVLEELSKIFHRRSSGNIPSLIAWLSASSLVLPSIMSILVTLSFHSEIFKNVVNDKLLSDLSFLFHVDKF